MGTTQKSGGFFRKMGSFIKSKWTQSGAITDKIVAAQTNETIKAGKTKNRASKGGGHKNTVNAPWYYSLYNCSYEAVQKLALSKRPMPYCGTFSRCEPIQRRKKR